MKRFLIALLLISSSVLSATQAQARLLAVGKVKKIWSEEGRLSLLIQAMGKNPAGLGKFIAHLRKSTKVFHQTMFTSATPAVASDIRLGNLVSTTFKVVQETSPKQVLCETVTIIGRPQVQPSVKRSVTDASKRAQQRTRRQTHTFRGTIFRVTTAVAQPSCKGVPVTGTVQLFSWGDEEGPAETAFVDVTVEQLTKVYYQQSDGNIVEGSIADLRPGMWAQLLVEGPPNYPTDADETVLVTPIEIIGH